MTLEEVRQNIGERVSYRQFADVIPETGKIVDTFAPWAMVLIDGSALPSELEPWCLTLLAR